MNRDVPKRNDLSPRRPGMGLSELSGQASARLSDQRQPMQRSALQYFISEERVSSGAPIALEVMDRLENIQETKPIASHRATASRSTSAATVGRRPRLETTSTCLPNAASSSRESPVRSSNERPGSKSTSRSTS